MPRGNHKDNLPRRLTLPFVLEDGHVPGMASRLLYLASGFVAACVVWASITEIRELAVAAGQIEPAGSVQQLQHLEGGIVSEILVSEGDLVESGQAIVRFQPVAANSELAQVRVRAASLALQVERQAAALDRREPDFGELGLQFPALAANQLSQYQAERLQLAQQKDALIARVEQKFVEVQAFHAQLESLDTQLAIDREQVEIREKLLEQGLSSRATYLDARRNYERTNTDLISRRGELHSSQEALNEARINLLELDSEFDNRVAEARAKAFAELSELRESLNKQEDRVDRLVLRSPVEGIVQDLAPTAIGHVIKPGDVVAQVVPVSQEMVAEVRIEPTDIGHISIGDPADVKITTFDPARFGTISGIVSQISASTFENEEGDPYYRAVISLDRNHVGLGGTQHMVLPGMVVNAEIVTGSKSLTRYLLKPVYRSFDIAFTER